MEKINYLCLHFFICHYSSLFQHNLNKEITQSSSKRPVQILQSTSSTIGHPVQSQSPPNENTLSWGWKQHETDPLKVTSLTLLLHVLLSNRWLHVQPGNYLLSLSDERRSRKGNTGRTFHNIHNTSGALLKGDEKDCADRLLIVSVSHHLGEGIKVNNLKLSDWIYIQDVGHSWEIKIIMIKKTEFQFLHQPFLITEERFLCLNVTIGYTVFAFVYPQHVQGRREETIYNIYNFCNFCNFC